MNVKLWLQTAKKQINPLDAELILLHALKQKDRSYLTLHDDTILSEEQEKSANKMLARRLSGEPLAYILGYKEFYGRDFLVNRHTLIPRPESESIIHLAFALKPKNILDVGTGSGCLAITLAAELPFAAVLASDIFKNALSIARQNAAQLTPKNPPTFIHSNLLKNIPSPENLDLIIANLPYVDPSWDWLDAKTLSHEPEKALYAEEQGLSLIKKLLREIRKKHLHLHLILEADPCQHAAIIDYASGLGFEHLKTDGFAVLLKR